MLESFCQGRLYAERTGTAPPGVVGLHGWARTRQDLTAPLAGLNALNFDLPGFGASPEPPAAWDTRGYAALLAEALGTLSMPIVILGHSFGGRVAVRLAAEWPSLVGGLVLTGVPLIRRSTPGATPARRFRMARWARHHGLLSERRLEELRQRYGSADYRSAQGVMRDVLVKVVNESYEDDLARITCPVELVWGANDSAAPVNMARQASGLLRTATLRVVPDAGHMTPLSAPAILRESVQRLVREGTR